MSQIAHDAEMASKNNFVNDVTTASYFWKIVRGGEVLLEEYDLCSCLNNSFDPRGHVHRIVEWPGKPVQHIQKMTDMNGNEFDMGMPVFVPTEPFEAYTLVASPEFLSHQNLPDDISYEIKPGDSPIWGHRVRFNTTGEHGGAETVQMIGVRHADGSEDVTTIYASGAVFTHESVEEAHAHSVTDNPHELNK